MAEVEILSDSVFVGHWLLHHSVPGWKRWLALRYQTYVIPEVGDLKMWFRSHMGLRIAAIATFMKRMKLRHLVMSVTSRNRMVSKEILTVTPGIPHWVLLMW